jgi:uncharacterized protein (DUF983 family)
VSVKEIKPGEGSFFDHLGAAVGLGLRRRCPRCGEGPIFAGWFRVRHHCPKCGIIFAPTPGDFGTMLIPTVWIPYLVLAFGLFFLEMEFHPSHLVHGIITVAYALTVFPLAYPFMVGGAIGVLYAMRRME